MNRFLSKCSIVSCAIVPHWKFFGALLLCFASLFLLHAAFIGAAEGVKIGAKSGIASASHFLVGNSMVAAGGKIANLWQQQSFTSTSMPYDDFAKNKSQPQDAQSGLWFSIACYIGKRIGIVQPMVQSNMGAFAMSSAVTILGCIIQHSNQVFGTGM